ncbi:MAG TPA: ferredoxin-type protein NapG [Chromatiales bacterium]|nr:ferredoxin-type protein NapG [Chromatiales bacterium]
MDPSQKARRSFLARLGQGVALAATGGTFWSYLLTQQATAGVFALRPPGALAEDDFHAKCIKCGQCVVDCPYDTLKLAAPGDLAPIGTPFFEPRQIPCYMCPDIPCMNACPTGALTGLERIEDARMGLAVIDIENCLSWNGLRCEVCYRVCPVKGKAITTEVNPRKLSKHAMFVPIVHSDACTGCGMCEEACPTEEAAIRVVQPRLVQGKIGEHYRLGWKFKSQITEEFKFEPRRSPAARKRPGKPAEVPGLDYLNQGEP